MEEESLDHFIRQISDRHHRLRNSGDVDLGADRQFERSFWDVKDSLTHGTLALQRALRRIEDELDSRHGPQATQSRFPGGAFLHRVVRRLIRRHLNPAFQAIAACRDALGELNYQLEQLSRISAPSDAERLDPDIWDRLATLDVLEAEMRVLRQGHEREA